MANETNMEVNSTQIIIKREINAPIELVWRNWAQQERLEKWWGPDGFSIKTKEFAFVENGKWRFDMISEEWGTFPNLITYKEIIPFEKIIYIIADDETIKKPERPIKFDASAEFEKLDECATLITLTSTFEKADDLKWVIENYHADDGAKQHVKSLADLVEQEAEETIVISRNFNHSCDKVFDAFITPEIAGKFMFRTTNGILKTCEIDAKIGGKFNIVETRDGVDAIRIGQFLMLSRPNKLMFTFGDNVGFGKTIVSIEIMPTNEGCRLVLIHRGIMNGFLEQTYKGWSSILENAENILL